MPRKAFVADLQEAISGFGGPNLSDLKAGDEDGTITFRYYNQGGNTQGTIIQAIVPGKIASRPFPISIQLPALRVVLLPVNH